MPETYTPFPEFDSEAVRQALGAESRSLRDVAHGEGEAVTLRGGKTELEVYPTAGVARVTIEHARVELFRVPGITTDDEAGHVLFRHGEEDSRSRLLVRADGNVSFYPVLTATGAAPTAETTGSAPVDQPTLPTRSQGASEQPEIDATTPDSEERAAVTLTGRLGQDPWFTRDNEVLIAGFPLAVNHEQGTTTWHTVKARGDAADQVDAGQKAGYIRRGKQVSVTGSYGEKTGKGKPPFEATEVTRAQTKPTRPSQRD
jgi:hypothetical protein